MHFFELVFGDPRALFGLSFHLGTPTLDRHFNLVPIAITLEKGCAQLSASEHSVDGYTDDPFFSGVNHFC